MVTTFHPRLPAMAPAASPPAVAVASRTTAAVTMNPAPGRERQRPQRSPKAATPLPILLQRPRLPLPPPPPTPRTAQPIKPIKQQNEAEDDEEEDDASGDDSMSTAVDVLRLMDALRLPVEADLYASLLKECTERRDATRGAEVHAHIRRRAGDLLRGPLGPLLANRLLLLYAASGRVDRALEMFDGMPTRDPISWATTIVGLSDAGDHREALRLFAEMIYEQGLVCGGPASIMSIATVLRSCAGVRDLAFGQCVHGLVLKIGSCSAAASESRMASSLIRLYGMLGQEDGALKVFRSVNNTCDSAVWDAMVLTYCKLGMVDKAFELFRKMRKMRRQLKSSLFSNILRACGRREEELPGQQVHACAIKHGVDGDRVVQSSLVEMYGRCGLVFDAGRVLTVGRHHIDAAAFRSAVLGLFMENESSMDAIKFLHEIREGCRRRIE